MRLRRSDLSWQELDGEIVVLDLAGSEYLKLNGTGAQLWKLIDGGADRHGLVAALMDTYDLSETKAEDDVNAFVGQLREAGLLEQGS